MSMFLVMMVFIFLIQSSMETNEQTKDTQLDEKDTELLIEDTELDVLSATRQRIRQLLTDYFAK